MKTLALRSALLASLYIAIISSFMFYAPKIIPPEDNILMPITFLSLFVLSAAVMAYLFCFEPIRLYLDGQKEDAVRLFLQTVGFFGCITVTLLLLMVLVS